MEHSASQAALMLTYLLLTVALVLSLQALITKFHQTKTMTEFTNFNSHIPQALATSF